jgi:hypothetical protein
LRDASPLAASMMNEAEGELPTFDVGDVNIVPPPATLELVKPFRTTTACSAAGPGATIDVVVIVVVVVVVVSPI